MTEERVRKEGVPIAQFAGQAPFQPNYLDSQLESTGSEVLTLRLNPKERAQINRLRRAMHYHQDAKVIKVALIVLENVVQGTFGVPLMSKLTDPDRRRVLLEKDKEETNEQNL